MKKPKQKTPTIAPSEPLAAPKSDAPADTLAIQARIRARAYEIHLERGGMPGRDLDDWLEAEREIQAEINKGSAVQP